MNVGQPGRNGNSRRQVVMIRGILRRIESLGHISVIPKDTHDLSVVVLGMKMFRRLGRTASTNRARSVAIRYRAKTYSSSSKSSPKFSAKTYIL